VYVGIRGSRVDGKSVATVEKMLTIPALVRIKNIDIEHVLYVIYEIIGIMMIFVKLFIIIARPFVPENLKLKMVWIGQTMIYYDLLSFSGLI
jgi:hypothetical protein